ncbi:hypothetical protein [Streptomyces sp. NBC_01435]|nr:hypothetical protein [Streptomyces sp. NBC_01435]
MPANSAATSTTTVPPCCTASAPRRGLAIDDFAALTAWATGLD